VSSAKITQFAPKFPYLIDPKSIFSWERWRGHSPSSDPSPSWGWSVSGEGAHASILTPSAFELGVPRFLF